MFNFDSYASLICLIVFSLLTIMFGFMIFMIVKLTKRSIKAGFDDAVIKKDFLKRLDKEDNKVFIIFEKVFNILFGVFCVFVFSFSLILKVTHEDVNNDFPTLRVVKSGSMSYKNSENKYLQENNLNDQIQTFDLVVTYKLPEKMDLKLFDIVVYELEGELLIHRIVAIENPTDTHPNERYFMLQGDANVNHDKFPVLYSQMKAIYRGERMPYIGSVFTFFQSPAGYLCVLLILVYVFGFPIIEKQINEVTEDRIDVLLETDKELRVLINEKYHETIGQRRLMRKKR